MLVPAAGLLGTLALAQGMVSTMSAPQGVIQMFQPVFRTDPRDDVAAWMLPRLKPGASIGLVQEPWFYSPALTVANGGPQSRPLFEETRSSLPYRLVLPEAENRTAFAPWPDFVVMSDYEYGDALRLQGVPVPERIAHIRPVPVRKTSPPEAQRLTRLWNNVLERYQVVGVWSPTPHVLGLRWSKRRLPPHDAFYSYPTIIVFVRKSG
jgi:hypothetical protein